MKNKQMKKLKKSLKKGRAKTNILVEMAEDFMDVIKDAKAYKKISKKR